MTQGSSDQQLDLLEGRIFPFGYQLRDSPEAIDQIQKRTSVVRAIDAEVLQQCR